MAVITHSTIFLAIQYTCYEQFLIFLSPRNVEAAAFGNFCLRTIVFARPSSSTLSIFFFRTARHLQAAMVPSRDNLWTRVYGVTCSSAYPTQLLSCFV